MTKFCTKLRVSAARLGGDVFLVGDIKVIDFGPVADDHEFGVDAEGFLHLEGNVMAVRRDAG